MSSYQGPVGAQDLPPPLATPPPPSSAPAGWYEDPWKQASWRWYDGAIWTGHIHGPPPTAAIPPPTPNGAVGNQLTRASTSAQGTPAVALVAPPKKPFLPSFLSWPVVLAAIPSIGFMGFVLVTAFPAFLLGLVPLFIVMPVLLWIDRVEPEPLSARIHTFLWGTFVAGFISVIVNTAVARALNETVAAVASAPFIEEITKGLAVAWMVKRKEVDSPIDGIVYAGWSAMGFAMIENMNFFLFAFEEDMLVEVFIGRALLTPFAHPLFTMWTGLAIGLAVRARKSPWNGLWGLALAMALHAAWNGSLTIGATEGGAIITVITALLFIGLFIVAGIGVSRLNKRDEKRYAQLTPFLASRYGLDQNRVALLLDRKTRRRARITITDKDRLKLFQAEASAMVRLAALFDHDNMPVPEDEARLFSQLVAARQAAS